MRFQSILFAGPGRALRENKGNVPDFFVDLNLDQLVEWIIAGKDEYALKPFFCAPPCDVQDIEYRHEVMRDLECTEVRDLIHAFAQDMRLMRHELAQAAKLYYKFQKQWWFVDAVEAYCKATGLLLDGLRSAALHSRGLTALRTYLAEYSCGAILHRIGRRGAPDQECACRHRILFRRSRQFGDRASVRVREQL